MGAPAFQSLAEAAARIVGAADPERKVALTRAAAAAWRGRTLSLSRGLLDPPMPRRPGRPERPALMPPRDVPRRGFGTTAGRTAFMHAIAHIELNAIDLAWDIVGRFAHVQMPRSFYDDWVRVGAEEAGHFSLLAARMAEFDTVYGDHPAHDGLWEAAEATEGDLLARLAIVPLVLEARGLDVTPSMVTKFTALGDTESAAVLNRIYEDEKGHVYVGAAWFRYLCDRQGLAAEPTFHAMVRRHFRGGLKPPFNDKARSAACLTPGFYRPMETIRT
ncbi:ferritin-like domain-containing protein [Acuticoccus sp. MNP-M23]|uniref:ferritin-like domain-containing protein n=1 Tax=Acuticoccus sp. MNP-M23 TaxID=3072793 RepID=UPI002815D701|nr:ferritin-like domain-containing protein [Acuticoccus sp. MNP-M23]WMS42538.1 ferritin-like domain-containing protein [Acuticoccus sp. MNP-M23]